MDDEGVVGGGPYDGYWEPHTASIDFCESNYIHTTHVAEPHNVWSSLIFLSGFGVLGLFRGNPTSEGRFALVHIGMMFIGLGSAALHGTLHWAFQSSDELPMLYVALYFLYITAELDSPRGEDKFPWLPQSMASLAALNTAVYYKYQHWFWVFFATFVSATTVEIIWMVHLLFRSKGRYGRSAKKIFVYGLACFLLSFVAWIFDMTHFGCSAIRDFHLPGLLRGMTPHVIWHFGSGLGPYCLLTTLACCRLEAWGVAYQEEWILGFIPSVRVFQSPMKANGTARKRGEHQNVEDSITEAHAGEIYINEGEKVRKSAVARTAAEAAEAAKKKTDAVENEISHSQVFKAAEDAAAFARKKKTEIVHKVETGNPPAKTHADEREGESPLARTAAEAAAVAQNSTGTVKKEVGPSQALKAAACAQAAALAAQRKEAEIMYIPPGMEIKKSETNSASLSPSREAVAAEAAALAKKKKADSSQGIA